MTLLNAVSPNEGSESTTSAAAAHSMTVYEQSLDRNLSWALREGSRHFERESAVHKALEKIAGRLQALQIPYAIAGGMALFFHGSFKIS